MTLGDFRAQTKALPDSTPLLVSVPASYRDQDARLSPARDADVTRVVDRYYDVTISPATSPGESP